VTLYRSTSQIAPHRGTRQLGSGSDSGDLNDVEYEDVVIRRLRKSIKDQVGKETRFDSTVLKNLKLPQPEKYAGEDDIEVFENWLSGLLKWFRITGCTGKQHDKLRVELCGTNLKDLASDWYRTEVEAFNREIIEWSFTDLICTIYRRFIHDVTAQNATDRFNGVRYSKAKGALAFYNELNHYANRMVTQPDNYSFKRRFLNGLAHDLVENLLTSRRVSAEHTSLKRLLHEAKAMESSMQAVERHRRARQASAQQQARTTSTVVVRPVRNEQTVRFERSSSSRPQRSGLSR
jgi:hypothetical protein